MTLLKKDLITSAAYIIIIYFYGITKNSFFFHWSAILDQDVTIIYNSLLVLSNVNQEYLDHPAYSTMMLLSFFYKILNFFNLIDINSIEDLLKNNNKNETLQTLHNAAQLLNIFYSFLLITIFKKILSHFSKDNFIIFLLTLLLIFSPSFIFLFDIIRSEILSLVFCFLYFLYLEKYIKEGIFNLIIAGFFFTMAMLAKVQIIFPLMGFLIICFIKNFEKGNFKNIFHTYPAKLNVLINIIFIALIIYYIDHFFFKRIDKIFFIFFLIINFIILAYFKKKGVSSIYPLIAFFFGGIVTILFIKCMNFLGIISYHPVITKLISSPIFLLAQITSGYQFGWNDNLNFILKVISIFKKQANLNLFILNKLCIVTYFASLFGIIWYFLQRNYNKIFLIVLFNIIFTVINIIFSIRPYDFYLIFTIPFNLIILAIILEEVKLKKTLAFIILITYVYLDSYNIKRFLNAYRENHNLNSVCAKEDIISKNSYMRYWHKKFDENFLYDLCSNIIIK